MVPGTKTLPRESELTSILQIERGQRRIPQQNKPGSTDAQFKIMADICEHVDLDWRNFKIFCHQMLQFKATTPVHNGSS